MLRKIGSTRKYSWHLIEIVEDSTPTVGEAGCWKEPYKVCNPDSHSLTAGGLPYLSEGRALPSGSYRPPESLQIEVLGTADL